MRRKNPVSLCVKKHRRPGEKRNNVAVRRWHWRLRPLRLERGDGWRELPISVDFNGRILVESLTLSAIAWEMMPNGRTKREFLENVVSSF